MTTLIASLILLLALEVASCWLPKRYTKYHKALVLKLKILLKRWKFAFEVAEKAVGLIKLFGLVARLIISIVPFVVVWIDEYLF